MARKSKRDWLVEGLRALAEVGASDLTIELMTARLGVTKGSFYHHFATIQDYRENLLAFYEDAGTFGVIDYAEQGTTPQSKLARLIQITATYPPKTEIAIRAWALQDPLAREVQERIDAERIAYVKGLFLGIVKDGGQAELMAESLYATLIGGYQLMPTLAGERLVMIFTEMMRLYGIELDIIEIREG